MLVFILVNIFLTLGHGVILIWLIEINQKVKRLSKHGKNVGFKLIEFLTFLAVFPMFMLPLLLDRFINAQWPGIYSLVMGLAGNILLFFGWFFIVFVPRMKRGDY